MDQVLGQKQELLRRRVSDQPEVELAMGLLAIGRRIDVAYNEVLAAHDLSGGRFAALLAVAESPGLGPARLAGRLEVRQATITGLVDGLVKRSLIVRGRDEHDRRAQTLTITAAGEQRLQEALPHVEQWLSQLSSGIGRADRETAWRLLTTVEGNLRSDADS